MALVGVTRTVPILVVFFSGLRVRPWRVLRITVTVEFFHVSQ